MLNKNGHYVHSLHAKTIDYNININNSTMSQALRHIFPLISNFHLHFCVNVDIAASSSARFVLNIIRMELLT